MWYGKIILTVSLFVPSAAVAALVEAQKDNVEVYATADKSAAVITKLKKGDQITSGERSGMYWQVKTADGKAGFVSILAVKVKPGDKAGLNEAMRDAVQAGRSQAAADGGRTRSAVMGVRGLDDTTETGMAASVRPNLHAVYAMEDFDLPRARVDAQSDLVLKEIESKMSSK